jgi:hypothetical protein
MTTLLLPMEGTPASPAVPYSVVVLHESAEAQERATELCTQLAAQLGIHFEVNCLAASTEGIQDPALAQDLAGESTQADMVVVALDSDEHLPESVRAWVEVWCERRARGGGALVSVVCAEHHRPDSPVCYYLREAAHRARMSYFSGKPPVPEQAHDYSAEALLARSRAKTETIRRILMPADHWGINE